MFKCEVTGKLSKPLEKLQKITVKTREATYRHWDHESDEEWFTHGTEIVREINATEEGLKLFNKLSDEERSEFIKGLS